MKKIACFVLVGVLLSIFCASFVSAAVETEGIYKYMVVDNEAYLVACDENTSGDIVIPSMLGNYPVTRIHMMAFRNCDQIESIKIPDTVKIIEKYAFENCLSMTYISIPNSVISIGDEAFVRCSALPNITIPGSVTNIGVGAFIECLSLESILTEDSSTAYCSDNGVLFSKDKSVLVCCPARMAGTSYNIPDTVTDIADYAFYDCMELCSIGINEGVSRIGDMAFFGCRKLESLYLPESVSEIGNSVFTGCDRLTEISVDEDNNTYCDEDGILFTKDKKVLLKCPIYKDIGEYDIPETVTTIGNGAFEWCKKLTDVSMQNGIQIIGNHAFDGTNIKSIAIPDSVTSIGSNAFSRCNMLETVKLSTGLTGIEYGLLFDTDGLESIEIPYRVQVIGQASFSSCDNLKSIIIPGSVTDVQIGAFVNSTNLTDVYYYGTQETWDEIHIASYNEPLTNATLHFLTKTPAETLCEAINEQTANSCMVDIDTQTVTLLSDVILTKTVEIPDGGEIILDIDVFNIWGANESDALYIPKEASLRIVGNGTIHGGNTVDEQYNYVGSAVSNDGILRINGPTLIGGDEREMYSYAAPGVRGWGTTYFIEGIIQAGEGNYNDYVYYTKGLNSIILESDDKTNYIASKNEWGSNKRYIKAVSIPQGLSAPEKLAAIFNIIQPETCSVAANTVTLNKDFSCPYEIYIPTGDEIILDFNGHTVTTDDFFVPFVIYEQAKITLKGNGILTNKERTSGTSLGGMSGKAALISNDGNLTIDGITVIGVGLHGINNDGALKVQKGKIMSSDNSSGKDAIVNWGTIEVFGGEIIGGNATRDGNGGGDGIASLSGVSASGIYPIKLYGGIIFGGKGCGDGKNGRAINTKFNIGEGCNAYESDDGENYSELDDTSCYARYLKISNINDNPESEDGNSGTPSTKNVIKVNNATFDGEKATFDLDLSGNETITGSVYVSVYEGKRLLFIKHYTAEADISVSIEYTNGQNITVFWWDAEFAPMSLSTEVKFE